MPATKSTLHKAIVAQGHCWVIMNIGGFQFNVELFERLDSALFKGLLETNRAFLDKGSANSALAIIEQVLKHSKKD